MANSNHNLKRDFSPIFDEIQRYNTEGFISEIESVSLENKSATDEIRDFCETCIELGKASDHTQVVYQTFS